MAGEKILADIDQDAIMVLREKGLIWSSLNFSFKGDNDFELVELGHEKQLVLRRFFLSILWRFAISDLEDFADISFEQSDLEIIQKFLLNKSNTPAKEFYPINLVKLSKGNLHNHSPFRKSEVIEIGGKPVQVDLWRIFIDGLIVHVNIYDSVKHDDFAQDSPYIPSTSSNLLVMNKAWENSWQNEQLGRAMS